MAWSWLLELMHPVAPDQVQVWITGLQFPANDVDVLRVIIVVNRIRFLLANDAPVDEIALLRQSDLVQLALCELRSNRCCSESTETVVFEAKIFEPVTYFVGFRHHLRRP